MKSLHYYNTYEITTGDQAERQRKDQKLGSINQYLRDRILPQSEKEAKELVLSKRQ